VAGTTSTGNAFQSSNTATLTVNPNLVIPTKSPLATGTVGVNYSQTVAATGGSGGYAWSIASGTLPVGLSLNSATGQITGQPTTAGASNVTIKVTDSIQGTATKAFAVTINPALVITTNSPLPTGTVGVNYSVTLAATGGSGVYTWSVSAGALPGGLGLNSTTGQISGQPTTAIIGNVTIQVTDTNQAATSRAFALTINPPVVITTTSPLPTGEVGVNYSQTLAATGGSGQYTWSITVGVLPGGLGLNSTTGQISGLPTTATTANFTIQTTDTNQAATAKPFALTITPPAQIQTISPNSANAGLSLQVTINAQYSNFVQGTTQATFGPGISVGGATAGQPGPVTVNSPTSLIAEISINASAATGSQTVSVTTGGETASLANGFTINAAIPFITVDTTSPTAIPTNFSGFADEYLLTGVEYNDPKYMPVVQAMHPGFVRFPSGLPSMAFDWQAAHENQTWITHLTPKVTTTAVGGMKYAQKVTQAKGGVCFVPGTCFADFATFVNTLGAGAFVDFNGWSDTNTNSAGNMVTAAQANNVNVITWELANEPYVYPLFFPAPDSYASFETTYDNSIAAVNPNAPASVFYQGAFSFVGGNYQAWDNGMAAYTPRYWKGVLTHIYPITQKNISVTNEEQTLNGILAHGTTDYISSYLAPLVGANTPIYITEMNSDAYATLAFESYLYNGIFLAEYVARMSTSPYVKAVAVQPLYLGNNYNKGILRAVNDFESYLIAQVTANPNYSTNTATNPNTQFQFYNSANALCLTVLNLAVNNSNAIWPTTVNGAPTVPIIGYDGQPIPAVFAQSYQGTDGTHYLVITNKSGSSIQMALEVNGNLLQQTVTVSYVSNSSDIAQNTATNQNNLQIVTTTSPNPLTVCPYSVTRVQW
jgi:hypothetical protein